MMEYSYVLQGNKETKYITEKDDWIMECLKGGDSLIDMLGDCPNIPLEIFPDGIGWLDLAQDGRFKIQRNSFLGYCRILDHKGARIAWGSESIMKEKYARLVDESFLRSGDIVGISRGIYEHYAVYVGDGEVIHYSGSARDMGLDAMIRRASFDDFLQSEKNYFVLHFESENRAPKKIFRNSLPSNSDDFLVNQMIYTRSDAFHLYSPDETVKRAEGRLGEKQYNLVTNNCEHFALWCKTGVSSSFQVKRAVISLQIFNEIGSREMLCD